MPQLVSFPLDHPLTDRVEAALGAGPFVAVPNRPIGPRSFCHANVDKALARHGGTAVLGWQIEWWPGLFVRALQHAVLELPDGTLLDVTERVPGDPGDTIAFVALERLPGAVTGNALRLAPARHFVLADLPEVRELIAASESQHALKRRLDQAMRERGFVERGGEFVAPDAEADAAFHQAHGDEMRRSMARVAAAIAACQSLGAE